MINSTSSIKRLGNRLASILVAALLVLGGFSISLMGAGKASADMPVPTCQAYSVPATILGAPTLLTPSNGSTNPNGFDFSWTAVNGATQYDWESSYTPDLNADGSFVNRLGYHRLTTTFINEASSPQNTYYWHVRAVAADDTAGSWSQTWRSTISNAQNSYLSAPELTFPTDGAVCNIYSDDFDFTWNAPATDGGIAPLNYVFQSSHSADTDPVTGAFANQPWTNNPISDTSTPDGGSPNGTYFWHVRAIGQDGTLGPWSATWSVTITREAPPVVTPPADNNPPVTPVSPPAENSGSAPDVNPAVSTTASSFTTVASIGTPLSNLFIPSNSDIAAIFNNTPENTSHKSENNKSKQRSDLAADISKAQDGSTTSVFAWIIALLLALGAAIFVFQRRRSDKR